MIPEGIRDYALSLHEILLPILQIGTQNDRGPLDAFHLLPPSSRKVFGTPAFVKTSAYAEATEDKMVGRQDKICEEKHSPRIFPDSF